MIILGNSSFATGMRLAGIKESFVVENRETAGELLKNITKDELIVVNTSILELYPELKEFNNVVTIPDEPEEFGSIKDLTDIVKSAVGFEPKLE